MCPTLFDRKNTRLLENNVRELFDAMTPDFRDHLMRSFIWTQSKLEEYLSRDTELQGDELKEACSHLESLLARIQSFAAEKSNHTFPSYDDWVTSEFEKYKKDRWEDREEIERLMDEGGVVAPGKTSPVDTMANDSLSHYNQLKDEHDTSQKRSNEAIKLMRLPQFKELENMYNMMNKMIVDGINHRR